MNWRQWSIARVVPGNATNCHNAALIPEQGQEQLDWQQVVAFIHQRRGLLDGIVFSGGEPTAQTALLDAMRTVKELGMKVALHTNGAYPDRLRALLPLCNWVGMDLKAPFDDYETITKCPASGEQARAKRGAVARQRCRSPVSYDRGSAFEAQRSY